MTTKIHTFKRGDVIAMWHDTGAFGMTILFGVVIAAGPKAYRARWESGATNRIEQGRTICWLYTDWKDFEDRELGDIARRLDIPIDKLIRARAGERAGQQQEA